MEPFVIPGSLITQDSEAKAIYQVLSDVYGESQFAMYGGGLFLEKMGEPHHKTYNRYYVLFDRDLEKLETCVLPKLCRMGDLITEGLKSPYDMVFSPLVRITASYHNHVIGGLISNEKETFFHWLAETSPGRLEHQFAYHDQKFYMNPAMADLVTGKSKAINSWFSSSVKEHLAFHLKIKSASSNKKASIKKAPPEFHCETLAMPVTPLKVEQ